MHCKRLVTDVFRLQGWPYCPADSLSTPTPSRFRLLHPFSAAVWYMCSRVCSCAGGGCGRSVVRSRALLPLRTFAPLRLLSASGLSWYLTELLLSAVSGHGHRMPSCPGDVQRGDPRARGEPPGPVPVAVPTVATYRPDLYPSEAARSAAVAAPATEQRGAVVAARRGGGEVTGEVRCQG